MVVLETGHALERQDGHYVYNKVKNIKVAYGKKNKDVKINKRDMPPIDGMPFKKMSIFFKYLPYGLIWSFAIPSTACT